MVERVRVVAIDIARAERGFELRIMATICLNYSFIEIFLEKIREKKRKIHLHPGIHCVYLCSGIDMLISDY